MATSTETCDVCGKTFRVQKISNHPGGLVEGCPEQAEDCGLAQRGFTVIVEGEEDE